MKQYEVSWIIMFAQVFSKKIEAKSAKEARKIASDNIFIWADSSNAEQCDCVIDKPILISKI